MPVLAEVSDTVVARSEDAMKLEFDSSVIRPLVQQVVAEAISRLEESGRQHVSQLAYT